MPEPEQQAQQLTPQELKALETARGAAEESDTRLGQFEIMWIAARAFFCVLDGPYAVDDPSTGQRLDYPPARVAGCPDEGRRDVTEGASVPLTVSEALVLYDALTGRDVGIQRNEHYLTGFRKLHEARLRLSPQMGTGA